MNPISQTRFNALAGYCRQPQTLYMAKEIAWYQHADERVLGVIIQDITDGDYSGITLAHDRRKRYRSAAPLTDFHPTIGHTRVHLRREMERLAMASDTEYYQGDEVGEPVDFFEPVVEASKLNSNFLSLSGLEGFSPAREIINPMMRWHNDLDGNFIQQFQTTGFDARLWELYLFAVFSEMGYLLDTTHAAPDFDCSGVPGSFVVEAVTINPSRDKDGAAIPLPSLKTQKDRLAFIKEYMPIRFANSLTSKLKKRYWEKPHVQGRPLLFAIQDFSAPGSMTFTRSSLSLYLYGVDYSWEKDTNGKLHIIPHKKKHHRWNGKKVLSGFFSLADSKYVSAVLFSNSGTISKFNRMGVMAGFGSPNITLIREGTALDHDPNATDPIKFRHEVNETDYNETWSEGIDIYHNPNAKHPIDPKLFPGAAHHRLLPDDQMDSLTPEWHPLGSITKIMLI